MKHRSALVSAAFGISMTVVSSASVAAVHTLVNVKLQDPSSNPPAASMQMALDQSTVPAGKVTFHAVNLSKNAVHELLVVRTDGSGASLPYDESKSEVVEKRIRHLGEIADLKPGSSGSMTLALKPGAYELICNQPGHYKAGMAAALTVTR